MDNNIINDKMTTIEFEQAIRDNPYEVFEQAKNDERLLHNIIYAYSRTLCKIEHIQAILQN